MFITFNSKKAIMISLGIESTAHTIGIGIIDENGNILADERDMMRTKEGSGFIPRELFEHHQKIAVDLLKKAIDKAEITIRDVDVISFSQGMGIPNALRVGAALARYLAIKYKKPLVGVNHGVAHIEIGRLLTKTKDPVVVYISGGNTQIITYVDGRYRILGETEDIPLGNALDELARFLGYPMPGGPKIEELAKKGKYADFPYVVKGSNVSFSGLVTHAKRLIKKGFKVEDVCFSFQETAFAMLVEVTERVLAHTEKNEVLVVGGGARKKRLQEMFRIMGKGRDAKFEIVPFKYAGDNGVMIAWTGLLSYEHGQTTKTDESTILQKWRIDEVEVPWMESK